MWISRPRPCRCTATSCIRHGGLGPGPRPAARSAGEPAGLGASDVGARPGFHPRRAGPVRARGVGEAARRLLPWGARRNAARPDGNAGRPECHHRRSFPRRRSGDAVRLPVPRAVRAAGAGQQRRPRPRDQPAAPGTDAARLRVAVAPDQLTVAAEAQRDPRPATAQLGIKSSPDIVEEWRGFSTLGDAESRRAFLATIRTVVGPGGQTVDAHEKIYLFEDLPVLLVWGARDRLIPVKHAVVARQAIPGSRLEVFEDAGHFSHLCDPERFARVLRGFIHDTSPRRYDPARWRAMLAGAPPPRKRETSATDDCAESNRSPGTD